MHTGIILVGEAANQMWANKVITDWIEHWEGEKKNTLENKIEVWFL